MTENLEFFSEVILPISVILSLCISEAPPLFIHVKIHAVARQAFFIFYQHHTLWKKSLSSSSRDKGRAMAQYLLVLHSRMGSCGIPGAFPDKYHLCSYLVSLMLMTSELLPHSRVLLFIYL